MQMKNPKIASYNSEAYGLTYACVNNPSNNSTFQFHFLPEHFASMNVMCVPSAEGHLIAKRKRGLLLSRNTNLNSS